MESYESRLARVESEALDEIYDAIFDPTAWCRLVAVIGAEFPEFRPVLRVEDWRNNHVSSLHSAGWDPEIIGRYRDEYADKNCFMPVVEAASPHQTVISSDFVSERAVLSSVLYADILKPEADIRLTAGYLPARDQSRFAAFAFHFPHRHADLTVSAGMRLLERLRPHMVRAFALGLRAFEGPQSLEAIKVPTIAVTKAGQVVRVNEAARPLMESQGPLTIGRGSQIGLRWSSAETARLLACIARTATEGQPQAFAPTASPTGTGSAQLVPVRPMAKDHGPVAAFAQSHSADVLLFFSYANHA